MKTVALETFLVAESILFWLLALPFALVAFPVLALIDKLRDHLHSVPKNPTGKRLTPRLA